MKKDNYTRSEKLKEFQQQRRLNGLSFEVGPYLPLIGGTLTGTLTATTVVATTVGIGTASPTTSLDVNSNKVRVRTAKTPASATDAGNAGDICWDANYVYVCVATNTWKRSALVTW